MSAVAAMPEIDIMRMNLFHEGRYISPWPIVVYYCSYIYLGSKGDGKIERKTRSGSVLVEDPIKFEEISEMK